MSTVLYATVAFVAVDTYKIRVPIVELCEGNSCICSGGRLPRQGSLLSQ